MASTGDLEEELAQGLPHVKYGLDSLLHLIEKGKRCVYYNIQS